MIAAASHYVKLNLSVPFPRRNTVIMQYCKMEGEVTSTLARALTKKEKLSSTNISLENKG